MVDEVEVGNISSSKNVDIAGRDIARDAMIVNVDSNLSNMVEILIDMATKLGGIQTTLSILASDLTALRTIVATLDIRTTKHDAQIAQLEQVMKRRGRLDIG
jgi:hypothetical protein